MSACKLHGCFACGICMLVAKPLPERKFDTSPLFYEQKIGELHESIAALEAELTAAQARISEVEHIECVVSGALRETEQLCRDLEVRLKDAMTRHIERDVLDEQQTQASKRLADELEAAAFKADHREQLAATLRNDIKEMQANLIRSEAERDEARAEAQALRAGIASIFTSGYLRGHEDTVEGCYTHVLPVDYATYFAEEAAQELAAIDAARSGPSAGPQSSTT